MSYAVMTDDELKASLKTAGKIKDPEKPNGWELAVKLYHLGKSDKKFAEFWKEEYGEEFQADTLFEFSEKNADNVLYKYNDYIRPLKVSEVVRFIGEKAEERGIVIGINGDDVQILADSSVITKKRKQIVRTGKTFSTNAMQTEEE